MSEETESVRIEDEKLFTAKEVARLINVTPHHPDHKEVVRAAAVAGLTDKQAAALYREMV